VDEKLITTHPNIALLVYTIQIKILVSHELQTTDEGFGNKQTEQQ
jgi:hypothetical protein